MSDDKLTPDEKRDFRGPLYEFAVYVHAKVLKHDGLFKDCMDPTCLKALAAVDSLDV